MLAVLTSLAGNKYARMAALIAMAVALLHVAHCYHDRKLIADYEAGVQARIGVAKAEATELANEYHARRSQAAQDERETLEGATEGLGEETPAGEATSAFHRALCLAEGRTDC